MRSRLLAALLTLTWVHPSAPVSATPTSAAGEKATKVMAEPGWQKRSDGLEIQEVRIGEGTEARVGSTVDVHYTGWLLDGSKFDSSRDRGKPYSFRLGLGMVIQGWDLGIAGMKPGGIRKLRIPPDLAYGARGASDAIPPDSALLFEVELVALR